MLYSRLEATCGDRLCEETTNSKLKTPLSLSLSVFIINDIECNDYCEEDPCSYEISCVSFSILIPRVEG